MEYIRTTLSKVLGSKKCNTIKICKIYNSHIQISICGLIVQLGQNGCLRSSWSWVQIPLSPMYIWVHIIANENKFYRKRDYSKLVAKLSTTVNKIQNLSNSSNSKTLNEFLMYMKNNGSSERHQNNNLNVMIEFSNYLDSHTTFYNINKSKYYHFQIQR